MATTYLQFLHISEFYQTLMFLILMIPLGAYVQVYRKSLWIYLNLKRVEEAEEYESWANQEEDESADNQIQKQIDSMEENSRRQTKSNLKQGLDISLQPVTLKNQEDQQIDVPEPSQEQRKSAEANPAVEAEDTHSKPQLTAGQTRVMYMYNQIVDVYQKHLPVIMTVILYSILTNCCEVFSLALFFCYIFATIILDYAQMFNRMKKQYKENILAPFVNLISSVFLFVIFINLLIREEYSLI